MLRYIASRISIVAAAALFALPIANHLAAQESAKAFFKVDIDVQKLLANKALGKMAAQFPLQEIEPELAASGLSLSDFKRIRFASTPSVADFAVFMMEQNAQYSDKMDELGFFKEFDNDNYDEDEEEKRWAELEKFQQKQLEEVQKQRPEFFMQFEFASAEAAKNFMANGFPPDMPEETLNGKTIKRTPAGKMLGIYHDGNTKLTVGSDKYLFGDTTLSGTSSIESYFTKNSDRAVRVAVDLDAVRPQIAKIKSQGEVPIMVFGIVDAIKNAAVAVDLDNNEMANLVVNTDEESNAELIASQINGALRMVKMQAAQAVNSMFNEDSKEAKTMIDFFNSLNCDVDGAAATMSITKPEGFDAIATVAMEKAREAAKRMEKMNNFRQIAIGIHNYYDVFDRCPFPETEGGDTSKDLSWRVSVLQFSDGYATYDKFNVDQAWNSATNLPLSKQAPGVFGMGEKGANTNACWIKASDKPVKFQNIIDGTSNTIMLMENPKKVTWSKPGDLSMDDAVNLVKNLKDGEELIVVFYDASTSTVTNKADIDNFKAMLTLNGGEIVDRSKLK